MTQFAPTATLHPAGARPAAEPARSEPVNRITPPALAQRQAEVFGPTLAPPVTQHSAPPLSSPAPETSAPEPELRPESNQKGGERKADARAEPKEPEPAAGGVESKLSGLARWAIERVLDELGIPPASFWPLLDKIGHVAGDIVVAPIRFANNLLGAMSRGFRQFFDGISGHLLKSFVGWLCSSLGDVGVQIPTDASPRSIITFLLQLMGIGWARIRHLIARHIGEDNLSLIETAYEFITTLAEKGPEGIFELIKDLLDPRPIIDMVIQMAVGQLIEVLITRVAARILLMFNPAGAVAQAIEAIYRVLAWIFRNAARLFRLVETVVNGMADIIVGNIGGMANAIERALAGLIGPVIGFLADYFGLAGLPKKIAAFIGGLQKYVEGLLDRVIGWVVKRAKALFGRARRTPEEPAPPPTDGNLITEPLVMHQTPHTLTIDPERGRITLASVEQPLHRKVEAGIERLKAQKDDVRAQGAIKRRTEILKLIDRLDAIKESLPRETQKRVGVKQGSKSKKGAKNNKPIDTTATKVLRDLGRAIKVALEFEGNASLIEDISDGLQGFGPLIAGRHRIRSPLRQPDGTERESHHVPPHAMAVAIHDALEEFAQAHTTDDPPLAAEVADTVKRMDTGKDGLSAVLLHRVTHQNNNALAVHSKGLVLRLKAFGKHLFNKDPLVKPSKKHFKTGLLESLPGATPRSPGSDARPTAGAKVDKKSIASTVSTYFSDETNKALLAVREALAASVVDGPHKLHQRELESLRRLAYKTWATKGLLFT